jgi:PAS domain S-box-containing protein
MAQSVPADRQQPAVAGWRRTALRVLRTLWFQATVALLIAYLVILPLGITAAIRQGQAVKADARAHQEERLQAEVQRLRLGVARENAGIRGYVLTADPAFLADYNLGRDQAGSAWTVLAADIKGSGLESELPPLKTAIDAWTGWAADARSQTDASGAPVVSGAALDQGQNLLVGFRAAGDRLDSQAGSRAARDLAESNSAQQFAATGDVLGPIVGNGLLVVLGSILIAVALRPVSRLADVATRLAAGAEVLIPYTRRRSEVGSLARALVRWQNAERSRRAIVEHTPVGMLTLDLDLRVHDPNPALLEMLGYTAEEMSTLSIDSITYPEDRASTREVYAGLAQGESDHAKLEKRYVRKDSSWFWGALTAAAVRGDDGRPANFVGILEDISERKEKLARAARVQRDLLPDRAPVLEGYELAGLCRPTEEVGGDFFDWYQPRPGTLVLTLGDVMGKGLTGAMLMATMRIALRSSSRLPTVGEAVQLVAESTLRDLEKAEAFTTLFHARLDLETGLLTYVDAGHGLVVVVGEDRSIRLPRGGALPLGVLSGERYIQASVTLNPGDALAVFSDGVLDVHPDLEKDLEGTATKLLAGAETVQEMAERLATNPKATITDDVTVVVLRRQPLAAPHPKAPLEGAGRM